ncbi:MAG: glycosyltransferase [Gammaproteobacteria bacterium]
MKSAKIIRKGRIALIKGSGVDLLQFRSWDIMPGMPIAMFAGRLLRSKGVEEFVQACQQVNRVGQRLRCVIVGQLDPDNPSSLAPETIQHWIKQGGVEWWGFREDMPDVLRQARLVCLPTYYGEGLPKILLEAAACGRPLVATDIPGCREIVRDGETGYLVTPRDTKALVNVIERLIADPDLCSRMGMNARRLAESEFSVEKVNQDTLQLYSELLVN